MTNIELSARAEALWDGIINIQQLVGIWPAEWLIETITRPHILDAKGNPVCHTDCMLRGGAVQL